MTPADERGAPLSVQRAFVVHLTAGGSRRRRYRGRVEHLSTGASTHFSSLEALLAFFAAALDAAPQEAGRRPQRSERRARPGPGAPAVYCGAPTPLNRPARTSRRAPTTSDTGA
jgi:hypothetical protein